MRIIFVCGNPISLINIYTYIYINYYIIYIPKEPWKPKERTNLYTSLEVKEGERGWTKNRSGEELDTTMCGSSVRVEIVFRQSKRETGTIRETRSRK